MMKCLTHCLPSIAEIRTEEHFEANRRVFLSEGSFLIGLVECHRFQWFEGTPERSR